MYLEIMKKTFQEVFNKEAESCYFAPGRINLIGEHIDYNGGKVFPAAITIGTYALVALRDDQEIHGYSMNFKELGVIAFDTKHTEYDKTHEWMNYIKAVAKYLQQQYGPFKQGLDILIYGNIPNGSGLSSSASLEMLITHIFKMTYQLEFTPVEAALLGKKVENEYMGVNSGIMDQFAIALGKEEHAILLDCNTLDYTYYPISLGEYKVVIMNTNKRRELADSKYNERRLECDDAIVKLRKYYDFEALCELTKEQVVAHQEDLTEIEYKRAYHSVTENRRVIDATKALKVGDLEAFGKLLKASHISLRDDYQVSGIELDTLVEAAWEQPHTLGARMTGAGFGGCAFALVKKEAINDFTQAVGKIYEEKIGYKADFYVAEIGNGPRKL